MRVLVTGGGPRRPRPLAETVADMVRWMHETGQLTDRQSGRAILRRAPMTVS